MPEESEAKANGSNGFPKFATFLPMIDLTCDCDAPMFRDYEVDVCLKSVRETGCVETTVRCRKRARRLTTYAYGTESED